MNSASRPRARAPLARALSNKRLFLLAIGGAILAVAFAYCLIAIQSVYISSVAAAVSLAAFEMSLLFCYAVFRSKSAALENVQSGLLPQINVLGLRKRINAVNNERGFDLIVRNDGTRPVENCSVAVTSIKVTRYTKARGEQTLDISSLYAQELPLTLAIPAGPGGVASDSFRLRPSEIRRIPVCSRQDGQRSPLQIYFSANSPLRQVPDFAFGEIGLVILGEPREQHETLHLSVRGDGVLEVSRVG